MHFNLKKTIQLYPDNKKCILSISLTLDVIESSQAIRILSAVAGASNLKNPVIPFSSLAAAIASLIAKKAALATKRGGSPTA